MSLWRRIFKAIEYADGTAIIHAGLIGAPLGFDPPQAAATAQEQPVEPKSLGAGTCPAKP